MTKTFEAACRPIGDEFCPVIIEWENNGTSVETRQMKTYTTVNAPQMTRKAAKAYAKALIAGDIKGDFENA
jgi:hypothetical protein